MLTEDVRRVLQEGAARPSRAIEVGDVLRGGRRLRRRGALSAAVLGLAVAFGITTVATNLDAPTRSKEPSSEPNRPAAFLEGWTELPLPPEVREGVAFVGAGSELLAWGGCDPAVEGDCAATADGYAFDPETRSWSRLKQAPIPGAYANAVWTGTEAIFLGFGNQPLRDRELLEGQAYNPETGTWRTIAQAPLAPRTGAVAVWTGSEVIVWGGGDPGDATVREGAAYNPSSDEWRRIADAPVGLNHMSGLWTGREMLVFGSLLDNRNHADTRTSVGAAYDPASDKWRELPPSELSPQATSAVWVGDRMVAWDYEVHSQEFDPNSNTWSKAVKMPLDFSECYPDSVVVQGRVFAFFCGRAALFDVSSGTWEEIHGGLLDEEVRSLKLWRFAWLVSTGSTVFLLAEGITFEQTGEPCFGCPESPVSIWAYRPFV